MDKFLEIVSRWDHFGQGLFFLLVFAMFFSVTVVVAYFITVIFRGWPSRETLDGMKKVFDKHL